MSKITEIQKTRFAVYGILLIGLILSYFVIKSYIGVILVAVILSYVFYPLNKFFRVKLSRNLAPVLTISLVLLVVILPLGMVANSATKQAFQFFSQPDGLKQITGCASGNCTGLSALAEQIGFAEGVESTLAGVSQGIINFSKSFIVSLPGRMIDFFVLLFLFYYFLRDGKKLLENFIKGVPLPAKQISDFKVGLSEMMSAVVYGNVIVSLMQGIITGFMFWIFGVNGAFVLGLLAMVAAFIPYIGTPIIWVPVCISLIWSGISLGDNSMIGRGIGILIIGVFVIGLVDNFLKPKIIGDKSGLHPAIILLGVLGGLKAFGVVGLFMGPMAFALLRTSFKVFKV